MRSTTGILFNFILSACIAFASLLHASPPAAYQQTGQLLFRKMADIKQKGTKVLDKKLYAEVSETYPVLIGVYHHLQKDEVQKVIAQSSLLTKPNGDIEFVHNRRSLFVLSKVDFVKGTFVVNGKVVSLHEVQTFDGLKREIESIFGTGEHSWLEWLLPTAYADGGIVSIPTIISLISLALAGFSVYVATSESWSKQSGANGCVKTVTDLIEKAHIRVVETKRICEDAPQKVEPQVIPESTTKVIIQANDKKNTNNRTISPADIARVYVNEFPATNFAIYDDYCETIVSQLKMDLRAEDPKELTPRARTLQRNIANLPAAREITVEDKNCVSDNLRTQPGPASPDSR